MISLLAIADAWRYLHALKFGLFFVFPGFALYVCVFFLDKKNEKKKKTREEKKFAKELKKFGEKK